MKNLLIIFTIFTFSTVLYAQQIPLVDFNFVNPYMFNPAKAGESGTRVFYLNRQQWKDIAGAPETSVLSLDHKISDKMLRRPRVNVNMN